MDATKFLPVYGAVFSLRGKSCIVVQCNGMYGIVLSLIWRHFVYSLTGDSFTRGRMVYFNVTVTTIISKLDMSQSLANTLHYIDMFTTTDRKIFKDSLLHNITIMLLYNIR